MASEDARPEAKRQKAGAGVTVVLGGQWGDEGKGKLVDILAQDADVVCRCQVGQIVCGSSPSSSMSLPLFNTLQGGNNAGHTVKVGGVVYDFHLLPR